MKHIVGYPRGIGSGELNPKILAAGIYLGIDAPTSHHYAQNTGAMLVVEVLKGFPSPTPLGLADCSLDNKAVTSKPKHSYAPPDQPSYLIVASPHQVLPLYVVHFEPIKPVA